jgi:uncharacterized protein
MTAFLPDVNVLIALMDPIHIHHDTAHHWFAAAGHRQWATCPMTENAVLRIMGSADYPNSLGSPAMVARLLVNLIALPGHIFWADDVSLLNSSLVDLDRLLHSRQVTDSYLLALASARGGRLATLDRRLITDAVADGPQALCLIH